MPSTASLTRHSAICVAIVLALAGCNRDEDTTTSASNMSQKENPIQIPSPSKPANKPAVAPKPEATAMLAATEGSTVSGELEFVEMDGGVHVTGQLVLLDSNSTHGFHIHETGDCSAPDGTSAGGHFNPTGSEHGRVGTPTHHAGDTDNIVAGANGTATVDNRLEGATIGGGTVTDIVGKGVIVHAGVDDYTSQPTGDAGARLACGVIKASK